MRVVVIVLGITSLLFLVFIFAFRLQAGKTNGKSSTWMQIGC